MTMAVAGLLMACAPTTGYRRCEPVSAAWLRAAAPRLSETGLFSDLKRELLAPGVVPYRPRFELWSDGETKRRWVLLPPGARIDTSDMDAWQFPTGTKFWKEFTRDGVRVETRLLEKVGAGEADWLAVAYLWTERDDEAWLAPAGVVNSRGTAHEVPAADRCMGCHGGTVSRVLGFSALQVNVLALEGRVTDAPRTSFEIPGDPTTRAALGYLHANCGHCHNQHRPPAGAERCFDPKRTFDLSLRTDQLDAVSDTPVYRTAMKELVVPGNAKQSPLVQCVAFGTLFRARMPPLATGRLDVEGLALLEAWINSEVLK